jgi:hypothetical protein
MRFRVGRLTCEFSIGDEGEVVTTCRPEASLYLNLADRRLYRAGRDAFLRAAGKLPARLTTAVSWRALRQLPPTLLVAATLAGCARGGGIGRWRPSGNRR